MSTICGWLSFGEDSRGDEIVRRMGAALRVHSGQTWDRWTAGPLAVGLLEPPVGATQNYDPAISPDGRSHLWFAGEVFVAPPNYRLTSPDESRTPEFRAELLREYLRVGESAFAQLDGEFNAVIWDYPEQTLRIVNDRFGGLPLYWSQNANGFGFAAGVRGVLMAPGVCADPDCEALREALTFGGFRLGDRTNVTAVKMFPAATVATIRERKISMRCYWNWNDIAPVKASIPEALQQLTTLWSRAIDSRLKDAKRPGQTLSGGLDSRAILAEAAPKCSSWTAITYGIPGCDDARYAEAAARRVNANWIFHPLYSGTDPDWLDLRTSFIQETDGLIQLGDLMHLETLSLQARLLDTHLSGYIGDAVIGPTFNGIDTLDDALDAMPYYGDRFGIERASAVAMLRELAQSLGDAPLRFLVFDHKLPQSTNRWTAAWRPWFRVRKPFTDYALFDFAQGLQPTMRNEHAIYERWLLSRYPQLFGDIPNQKTGMPILTPRWRVQIERAQRYSWRKFFRPLLNRVGIPAKPRLRYYTDDERFWSAPSARRRIEDMILRKGSISSEMFGQQTVRAFLSDWFERGAAPAPAVGAMYVYEAYHRDLSTFQSERLNLAASSE
jgi:asparagine synthase (glutamine-hydrolysing)